MGDLMRARPIGVGEARGELIVSHEALSFWGGYDQNTGQIIDHRHPLNGQNVLDKVLAIPFTRGSSTTTAVLLEAVRLGMAPLAILTRDIDSFVALASIVADELYGKSLPVFALHPDDYGKLQTGQWIHVNRDGTIVIDSREASKG
jgi:predicted aconitase with swiveling domain